MKGSSHFRQFCYSNADCRRATLKVEVIPFYEPFRVRTDLLLAGRKHQRFRRSRGNARAENLAEYRATQFRLETKMHSMLIPRLEIKKPGHKP